jgi:hypothetical protein
MKPKKVKSAKVNPLFGPSDVALVPVGIRGGPVPPKGIIIEKIELTLGKHPIIIPAPQEKIKPELIKKPVIKYTAKPKAKK